MPSASKGETEEVQARLREHERIAHFETIGVTAEGRRVHLSVAISPQRNAGGEVIGISRIARDISERVRMQEELRAFTAKLEETDRRKNEFLAILAHELRNPLTPIRNGLRILQEADPNAPADRPAINLIQRQLTQMMRVVDELLDLSRVNCGSIELRRERVELGSLVQHAAEAARGECDAMRQELIVSVPSRPVFVDGDPVRLLQVVGNLLSNASKFTASGGRIELHLECEDHFARISVKDNGVGIAASQLSRIFEMFAHAELSLERTHSGLGIGLTLAKTLVNMHGGDIATFSDGLGKGSEFVVRLPMLSGLQLPAPEPVERPETPSTPLPARRILVIDDNRDAADSLALLLQMRGHETHTAYDGVRAVQEAAALLPDVILLDIGLPGLNGYEAARRIRAQRKDRGFLLVAVTGWSHEDDRRRSREAGFDVHLVKPVALEAIEALLARLPDDADAGADD